MNTYLLFASLAAVLVSIRGQGAGLSPFLANSDLVQREIDCVLDRGQCDEIGTFLKSVLPEVVGRNCASCTPEQAATARSITEFVRTTRPDAYNEIQARYG
ncbi:hypothetical protein L9F63_020439 [Diploptera punctata]|uniref:Chemosensory protein n=1 Tax=Diploptera punctata TaxID=6984 RepID=A0AAD7ZT09_DIPPU|nr:hypothetical protein L9F63_020439 [Diploptera punctata]